MKLSLYHPEGLLSGKLGLFAALDWGLLLGIGIEIGDWGLGRVGKSPNFPASKPSG